MLSSVVSVQGSDTTIADSSIAADPKKEKVKEKQGNSQGPVVSSVL
jgi:hypothetical protein